MRSSGSGEHDATARVLLLTNDEGRSELFRRLLFSAGFRAAVEVLRPTACGALCADSYDLIAVDGASGAWPWPNLLRRLDRRPPSPPLVVFTSKGEARTVSAALRLGAAAILNLPASPAAVRARLAALARSRAVLI